MSDFNWNFPADMKPSGRSLREVCEEAQEDFFKANGYYYLDEEETNALILILMKRLEVQK